jgi:pilus assembly protein CpaB
LKTLPGMRKRLLIAVGFSIAAMVCGYLYISGLGAELTGGKQVPILTAAQEIATGTRLTKDHLAVRLVPEAYVHPGAITAGPAEEQRLIGRPVMAKLAQGQPLLWSDFDAQRTVKARLSDGVPRKQRAVTVPIDLGGSFAGMLRPGDHVDVLGTFSQGGAQSSVTVTLLQNLVVLAVGAERGQGPEQAEAQHGFNSVTLSVDLDQAEILLFGQQRGSLGFALRGDGDFETVRDIAEKSFNSVLEPRAPHAVAPPRADAPAPPAHVAGRTALTHLPTRAQGSVR